MTTLTPWHDFDWAAHITSKYITAQKIIAAIDTLHDQNAVQEDQRDAVRDLFYIQTPLLHHPPVLMPHILRFTLPLVGEQYFSEQHVMLRNLFSNLFRPMRSIYQLADIPPALRDVLDDCTAILYAHLDRLTVAIDHPDDQIRSLAVWLSGELIEHHTELVPIWLERYARETQHEVQRSLLNAARVLCLNLHSLHVLVPLQSYPDALFTTLEQLKWFASAVVQDEKDPTLYRSALSLAVLSTTIPVSEFILDAMEQAQSFKRSRRDAHVNNDLPYNPYALNHEQWVRLLSNEDMTMAALHQLLLDYARQQRLLELTITFDDDRIDYTLGNSITHYTDYDAPKLHTVSFRHSPIAERLLAFLMVLRDCERFVPESSIFLSTCFSLHDSGTALDATIDKLTDFLR